MNRIGRIRKSVLLGGSALMLVLFASQAAQAQCTGTITIPGGGGVPDLIFDPVAAGAASSVNSLISVLNTTTTAFLNQTNAFIGSPANPQPNQMGGGVWGRGIGGRIDTESTGTATLAGSPGSVVCNTTTRTNFAGYQLGADLARLNVGGWNLHGGVTVGYVELDAKDRTPGQGSFSGNFQVPFAGVYGAATLGNFYIDAQLRADFFQNQISDPTNGVFNQNFNSRGIAFSANTGYNIQLGNNWFIEPSAGFVWSRVETDPLSLSGTFVLANSPFFGPPGTLQIGDVDSLLGRLSVRVGTTMTTQTMVLQPFATASIFHEFEGDVVSTFTTCLGAIPIFGGACGALAPFGFPEGNGTLRSTRVGTYGQFALGIAGAVLNTGWLGYARVDYRTGENIEGWSVNGGIRYQFTPELIAPAAPVGKGPVFKAPPAPVAVAYNWSGFYLGASAGTTWGDSDWRFLIPNTAVDPEFGGALVGGQVGFNYQFGAWVFGIEADFGWANAKGAKACPNGFFFTCETHIDSIGMVTGRLGYASDRSLFYVKGGYAAADTELRAVFNPDSQPLFLLTPPVAVVERASRTASGWTIGGGFEFGLTPNWSAKAEYMYYDLGTERFNLPASGPTDAEITGNIVRVGVNYRWNPFAVR